MAEASDSSSAAPQPLRVAYCTVSGFPYEYCEFHPDFKKCIAVAAADPALHQYLPIIMNQREASIESLLASLTLDTSAPAAAAAVGGGGGGGSGGGASGAEAVAAGSSSKGAKKEKEKAVLIFESKKNKGKKATVVRGLDAFGVKLSDASKAFKKKFASGSTVSLSADNIEEVEIQGDWINVRNELAAFIVHKKNGWGIQKEQVWFASGNISGQFSKVPAFEDDDDDEEGDDGSDDE